MVLILSLKLFARLQEKDQERIVAKVLSSIIRASRIEEMRIMQLRALTLTVCVQLNNREPNPIGTDLDDWDIE